MDTQEHMKGTIRGVVLMAAIGYFVFSGYFWEVVRYVGSF